MTRELRLLAISGSLRKGSFNTAALRALGALAPEGVLVEVRTLHGIPLYNEDLREDGGFPPEVTALREAVRAADALVIATPEYNYSFPGVIKNAVDWISRPPQQPFLDKPAVVFSVSPGITGGVRAQWALKPVLAGLGALVLPRPEVAIGSARAKFDDKGALVDEDSRKRLAALLEALIAWTRRFGAG